MKKKTIIARGWLFRHLLSFEEFDHFYVKFFQVQLKLHAGVQKTDYVCFVVILFASELYFNHFFQVRVWLPVRKVEIKMINISTT